MRIAVLGLGFMGSTHLKALRGLPAVELAAVYSSDENKLSGDLSGVQGNLGGPGEKFDFGNVKKFRAIEPLLDDPSIDAVDICLPTHLHASVAVEALRDGKHVLVEKPMALDGHSADLMMREARRNQRILMAAQVLRFFPVYTALRDALSDGRLGCVRHATFRRRCAAPAWGRQWLGDPEKSGGGIFDLLIHDVDMALHLFGEPESVSATGYEALDSGIDVITADLHYPGLGSVVIAGGWHHPKSYPFSMEYTVVADEGTLEYSSAGCEPTLYRMDGSVEKLALPEVDGYRAQIEYFADCCRTGTQPERCPADESAAAVRLTHLLLEARNENGGQVPCRVLETSMSA